MSQLFTVGGPGGILSAGEKFSYIRPLTPCSGRRRYKPRSGTTGDSDGYLLASFNPADELRRVLPQLAESDGVHQPMVAHVLLRTMPRINVVTDTRAQITSLLSAGHDGRTRRSAGRSVGGDPRGSTRDHVEQMRESRTELFAEPFDETQQPG